MLEQILNVNKGETLKAIHSQISRPIDLCTIARPVNANTNIKYGTEEKPQNL